MWRGAASCKIEGGAALCVELVEEGHALPLQQSPAHSTVALLSCCYVKQRVALNVLRTNVHPLCTHHNNMNHERTSSGTQTSQEQQQDIPLEGRGEAERRQQIRSESISHCNHCSIYLSIISLKNSAITQQCITACSRALVRGEMRRGLWRG